MVYLIHFTHTALDGILGNTCSSSFFDVDTRFFALKTILVNGMNLPPRVGLYLSKLNSILSICVRTNPLSDASDHLRLDVLHVGCHLV